MRFALVGAVAVVALVSGGIYAFAPPDAAGVFNGIEVNGYTRVAEYDWSVWEYGVATHAGLYLGPRVEDISSVISGSGLKWEQTDSVKTAVNASLPHGCGVAVRRYSDTDPRDEWSVTDAQRADIRSGRVEALELEVHCQ